MERGYSIMLNIAFPGSSSTKQITQRIFVDIIRRRYLIMLRLRGYLMST